MLGLAKRNLNDWETEGKYHFRQLMYLREDLIQGTRFGDRAFDAVVCHRLFHHLVDSETRRLAIRELKRISKGPVLVSFFSIFSLSALIRLLKYKILKRSPTDRIPIHPRTLAAEFEREGLQITRTIPVCWGISPMTILVAHPIPEKALTARSVYRKPFSLAPRFSVFGHR
jgi:hypothetical protein